MLVCCADKIHNLSSLLYAYKEQGEAVWNKFNAPAEKIFWFNGEVLQILRSRMDGELVRELEKVYHRFAKRLVLSHIRLVFLYNSVHCDNHAKKTSQDSIWYRLSRKLNWLLEKVGRKWKLRKGAIQVISHFLKMIGEIEYLLDDMEKTIVRKFGIGG